MIRTPGWLPVKEDNGVCASQRYPKGSHLYLQDRKNENKIIDTYRTVFHDAIKNIDCSVTDVCQFWFFFFPKSYIFIKKKNIGGIICQH